MSNTTDLHVVIPIIVSIGFTTNREFNSLRWKGASGPLAVLQVRLEAQAKYMRKGCNTMLKTLTPVGMTHSQVGILYAFCHNSILLTVVMEDGSLCAQKQNPAIPVNVLRDIFTWKAEGATEIDITHLRQRTVPGIV